MERREFILRVRRVIDDIERNLLGASTEAMENMSVRVDAALRQLHIAFEDVGIDAAGLVDRLQRLRRDIDVNMGSQRVSRYECVAGSATLLLFNIYY